jgi:signal transduction histidine kinase
MDTVAAMYRERGMSRGGEVRSVVDMRIVLLYLVALAAATLLRYDLTAWGAIPIACAAFAVGHRHSWLVTLVAIVPAGVLYGVCSQLTGFIRDWWAGMRPMVLAALVIGAAIGLAVKAGQELARQRLRQARQDERLSVAQDVHDVVAHHIAVVNVQAGAASHLLKEHPDKAGEALGHVTAASGKALDELGSLLGVMREPVTGIDSVGALLGDDVELTVVGTARPLPATVDVTAYRVVQESLTNARKHGTGTATLTLTYEPSRLIIETRNACSGKPGDGFGYGLTGMRERVALLGGELIAGPRGDEFVVRASMEAR